MPSRPPSEYSHRLSCPRAQSRSWSLSGRKGGRKEGGSCQGGKGEGRGDAARAGTGAGCSTTPCLLCACVAGCCSMAGQPGKPMGQQAPGQNLDDLLNPFAALGERLIQALIHLPCSDPAHSTPCRGGRRLVRHGGEGPVQVAGLQLSGPIRAPAAAHGRGLDLPRAGPPAWLRLACPAAAGLRPGTPAAAGLGVAAVGFPGETGRQKGWVDI